MRLQRSGGQSLVEMAFVAPILLMLIFGIIDMGWYIFSYATISQAVRNGAEKASQAPPYESWLYYEFNRPADTDYPGFRGDACVNAIMNDMESDALFFDDITNFMTISYPNDSTPRQPSDSADNATRNLIQRGPIEISVNYPIQGLTPLFRLLRIGDGSGTIMMNVTMRRSIENLGANPGSPNGVSCAINMADYRLKRDAN